MRPPASRRKNACSTGWPRPTRSRFNEAACKQAEERGAPGCARATWGGFNEAACKQAEERGAGPGGRPRQCGFNEAACKQAEERRGRGRRLHAAPASMRPPASRRKNVRGPAHDQPPAVQASMRPPASRRKNLIPGSTRDQIPGCFNEAACKQAEERLHAVQLPRLHAVASMRPPASRRKNQQAARPELAPRQALQ